jgi:hypothetical protein
MKTHFYVSLSRFVQSSSHHCYCLMRSSDLSCHKVYCFILMFNVYFSLKKEKISQNKLQRTAPMKNKHIQLQTKEGFLLFCILQNCNDLQTAGGCPLQDFQFTFTGWWWEILVWWATTIILSVCHQLIQVLISIFAFISLI